MTASKREPPTASADAFPRHRPCRLVSRFKEEIHAGLEHKCTSVSRTSSTRGVTVLQPKLLALIPQQIQNPAAE